MTIKKLNRQGSSFYFIYIGAMIFGITILYIVFSQVLEVHLQPLAVEQFQDVQDVAETTKFLGYWKMIPLLLIFASVVFFFSRTGQVTQQGR